MSDLVPEGTKQIIACQIIFIIAIVFAVGLAIGVVAGLLSPLILN